ncbi:SusC/RagA family TonB-linked outer membrane protein [Pedobacter frigoris]|nr:TonB-dependent receptor [Pedobacter frigoris]
MKRLYQNYVSKVLLTFIVSLTMLTAMGQNIQLSGKVTDESGLGVPNASVVVKGTKNGASTNSNGIFNISANKGDVLVITYTGYLPQEVTVGNQTTINVKLEEDTQGLDEVVVVGYGTMKKSKITGSVSKLDNKVLETGVRSNPASALAGTIPGLRVQQTSGRPGATPTIVLRGGTGYTGGGSPLVIVDGLLRSGFSDINQDDIESIEVLKDASATAIYGARASNGVVLITTKKGKEGVSNISIKSKVGINKLNIPFEFLNAEDYIYWSRKAIETSGKYEPNRLTQLNTTGPFGTGNLYKDGAGNILDGNLNAAAVWSPMFRNSINEELLAKGWQVMMDPLKTNAAGAYDVNGTNKEIIYKNFNYSDYALRDYSLTQDYNVSMTGGNEKGKYYAGLGHYDEKGMPINTYYKRLTFVLNGEYKVKPWLTSISGLNFANAKWRDAVTNSEGNYLTRSLGAPPTMRGMNEKGELLVGRDFRDGNPAVNDDKFIRKNNTDKFTLSQAFKIDFLSNLSMRVSGNYFYNQGNYESFDKDYLSSPNNYSRARSSSASFDKELSQTYNAVLNYNTTIASKHHLDVMGGTEYYDTYAQGLSASGSGAPTDDFTDLQYTSSEKDRRSIDTYHTNQRILSFFGRANYDYDEKYLLTATIRRDGYSRLINNRWGSFPGISLGWNIAKEDFFQPMTNVVNSLKLRASYGANGNVGGIGAYTLQGSYGSNKYNSSVGYLLSLGALPNPDLRWESLITKEVGLEARLLNKIDFSIAYYHRTTSDKIADLTFPATAGATSITTNNGDMQNQGVEVDLSYNILRNNDWNVNFNANMAYNANKILKLPSNGLPNNRQGGFQVYDPNSKELIWVGGLQEGQDPNIAYAYQAEGIIRTQADLDSYALKLRDLIGARVLVHPDVYNAMSTADKNLHFPIALGDVKWRDVNGDGVINSFDRVYQGRTLPRWTGGFGANASWKGITLSARFDYALGFVAYDGPRTWFLSNAQGTFNTTSEVFNTWTPENVNAKYPTYYWADQLYKNNTFRESSMFYNKADYLALREINLTYKLPAKWTTALKSEGINFSVSGQNLVYFSKSTLYSPESSSIGTGGAGSGGYPLPRTIIFGVQFIF